MYLLKLLNIHCMCRSIMKLRDMMMKANFLVFLFAHLLLKDDLPFELKALELALELVSASLDFQVFLKDILLHSQNL